MGARQFGARVLRVEDPALLTGRARFVDDVKLPGTLHAAFVRSPHAHARIGTIDTAAALAMPGVHAVLTADDMPGRLATEPLPMPVPNPAITALRTQHALARGEVCYVGEAVAVVIAENRYLAEDAAAAVAVDYKVLLAVSDCRDALAPGAPTSHSDLAGNIAAFVPMAYGDVERAFATAAHVFEEDIFQHRGAAMTLEGRAVLAHHEPALGVLTVWSATQTPHICRSTIADLLDRDPEGVRVIAPFVGGGFGT
jgi:carbon-monoxide dehydrogenase large subunit